MGIMLLTPASNTQAEWQRPNFLDNMATISNILLRVSAIAEKPILHQTINILTDEGNSILVEEFYVNCQTLEMKQISKSIPFTTGMLASNALINVGNDFHAGAMMNATGGYFFSLKKGLWQYNLALNEASLWMWRFEWNIRHFNVDYFSFLSQTRTLYQKSYERKLKAGDKIGAERALQNLHSLDPKNNKIKVESVYNGINIKYIIELANEKLIKQVSYFENGNLSGVLKNEFLNSYDFSLGKEAVDERHTELVKSAKRIRYGFTYISNEIGYLITQIIPATPAAVSDLKVGDIILSMNGTKLRGVPKEEVQKITSESSELKLEIQKSKTDSITNLTLRPIQ